MARDREVRVVGWRRGRLIRLGAVGWKEGWLDGNRPDLGARSQNRGATE